MVITWRKAQIKKLTFVPIMRAVDVFLYQILGLFIADHDSNVLPRGGAPVGIVIAFLRDFQAPPCSCSVLSRVNGQITLELLVSGKQTCRMSKTRYTLGLGYYFLGFIPPLFSSKRYTNAIKQIPVIREQARWFSWPLQVTITCWRHHRLKTSQDTINFSLECILILFLSVYNW